jgi:uncharacterized protein involved in exopolysaccharide biosynthesis
MKIAGVIDDSPHSELEIPPAPDVHLLDLLTILAYRWRFIAWFSAGAAIVAAVTVLMIPTKFTAVTVVLPPMQTSTLNSNLLAQFIGQTNAVSTVGNAFGIRNPGDMYVALFRTRTIEDAVIQRFGLMERFHSRKMSDARAVFEHNSTVTLGSKDGLIHIAVTDRDPAAAAAIANGYVDEFRKYSASLALTEASQRRLFFQQQLLEANNNLSAAEEAMKKTEQATGAVQLDTQTRSLVASAAVLRGHVTEKEVELEAMRSYATEDNPQVQLIEKQLSALKDQLKELGGTSYDPSSDLIVPKGDVPQVEVDYLRKLRDVKYYETITDLIGKQFELAKLDEAHQGGVIQVADVAVPPDKRSSPKRTLTVVLATAIGFLAACLWCLLAAGLQNLRNNPQQRHKLERLRAAFR